MRLNTLKGLGRISGVLLLAAGLLAPQLAEDALAGVVPAEGSAAMQAPAKNAAVVAKLIGMVNNRREKTLTGQVRTINDGKAQP